VIEVATEEGFDAIGTASEVREGVLDGGDEVGERGEGAVMGRGPLGGAPDELKRSVIWE